jgi:phosphatidylglycerophosphatase A
MIDPVERLNPQRTSVTRSTSAASGAPGAPETAATTTTKGVRRNLPRWIAVAGGFGYTPFAPGTAGSLVGVLVFLGLFWLAAPTPTESIGFGQVASPVGLLLAQGLVVLGLLGLGIWAAGRAEAEFGREDDGRIVIDEVVGQLVTLWPLPIFVAAGDFLSVWVGVVTGFVLFRVFDIWKPGAIRWAERRFEGGFGVMADDVVAGLYGAAGLAGVEWLLLRARSGGLV